MLPALLNKQFDLPKHKEQAEREIYNLARQHEVHLAANVPEEAERENAGIWSQTSCRKLLKQKRHHTK